MTLHTFTSGADTVAYQVCSTNEDVEHAISVLSEHTNVLLDCEGLSIGRHGGKLSLLCMGTPFPTSNQSIFVLDMPAITKEPSACSALSAFLARPELTKIVFDGRMDKIELDADLGIDFGAEDDAVIDLQLAELLAHRHGLESGRLGRLISDRFNDLFVRQDQSLLAGMHVVWGMDKCMQVYAPKAGLQKDDRVKAMHKSNEGYRWMNRPLEDMLVKYAAADIRALAHILAAFTASGVIPSSGPEFDTLKQLSARYVSRNGVRARVAERQPFSVGALFFPDTLHATPESLLSPCTGCGAMLTLDCFQAKDERGMRVRQQYCRACVAAARYSAQRRRSPASNNVVQSAPWLPV
ncbi:hypothetical protein PENSPDRAFT_644892 [Peniophora sp. CONT]|nr:hypothetical protein PENSPDRAFT_644892 [Peniophora sp. CONT]